MSPSSKKSRKLPPTSKFIPNLKQLHQAISTLPSTLDCDDDIFTTSLLIDSKVQELTFTKKHIQRGSKLVHRWIYEGKILIRNQDQDSVT